jgi:hypothetical protein
VVEGRALQEPVSVLVLAPVRLWSWLPQLWAMAVLAVLPLLLPLVVEQPLLLPLVAAASHQGRASALVHWPQQLLQGAAVKGCSTPP